MRRGASAVGAAAGCAAMLLIAAGCGHTARQAATVPGAWTWVAVGHPLPCAGCTFTPVAAGLSVVGGTGSALTPGRSIDIRVNVADVGPQAVLLDGAISLRVQVVAAAGGPALWAGTLPPLPHQVSGNGDLTFTWNERESDGRPLPAGRYLLQFSLPLTIDYSMGGRGGHETLRGAGDPSVGETFALPFQMA